MVKIRIDTNYTISNGRTLTFNAPADCSDVTGLIVYYPDGDKIASKGFAFVDSHGVDVGSGTISLFARNALVKVVLDVDRGKAYVQNPDTNAYLEEELAKKYSSDNKPSLNDLGAAAASHGNHVPSIETANDARFLRNDNTWQTITPQKIGASPSNHTHSITDLGGVKIVTGSYTGTGKGNAEVLALFKEIAHEITLPVTPKLLVVAGQGTSNIYTITQGASVRCSDEHDYYCGWLEGNKLYAGYYNIAYPNNNKLFGEATHPLC